MRALDEAYTIMGPTTIREVEEQIPTLDEHGNRWTLIRTRTLEAVPGPIGPAEIERNCRHTVPGHGHVYPVSDTEYEVFQGRMRLRVDPASSAREMAVSQPTEPVGIGAQSLLVKAAAGDSTLRRHPFLLYAALVVLPLAAAVWILSSPSQPDLPQSPTLTAPAVDTPSSTPTAIESRHPASIPTSWHGAQPMASAEEIAAHQRKSQVQVDEHRTAHVGDKPVGRNLCRREEEGYLTPDEGAQARARHIQSGNSPCHVPPVP